MQACIDIWRLCCTSLSCSRCEVFRTIKMKKQTNKQTNKQANKQTNKKKKQDILLQFVILANLL